MREGRAEEGRSTVALLSALLVHAVVGAVVWTGAREPARERVPELGPVELSLEEAETAETARPPRVEASELDEEGLGARHGSLVASMRQAPRAAAAEPLASGAAPIAVRAPEAADDTDGWSLRVTRVDVGFDSIGRSTLVGQAGTRNAANEREPRGVPRSTTGGVVEALDARDVELGLGRGGLLRSAVEDAVQDSSVMGQGTFQVRIDTHGEVTVGFAGASRDAAEWARLSQAIVERVAKKRGGLRFASGSQGMDVTVVASAKEQFPDGRDPKSLGNRVIATPGALKETAQRIDITLPAVDLVHTGKVCTVGLHVGLDGANVGGGCSPENIGTVPLRVVAARIVSESRL